jgi:hypothetical protein
VPNRDTVRAVAQVRVSGFLPSTSGLHFTNYYPHEPEIQIKLPFGPTLSLGDAANGLCGGMALVARDYFEARASPRTLCRRRLEARCTGSSCGG